MKKLTTLRNTIFAALIFFGLIFTANGFAQTNPAAFDMSTGSFTFTGFGLGTTTTYPTNMQGWSFGAELTSATLTGAPTADVTLTANSGTITSGSIRNEIANGISILNSGSNNFGAVVTAINTTGRNNVLVTFTAEQTTNGSSRINGLRLQYRVGTSGAFTDVSPTTEYLSLATTVAAASTFTDVALPSAVDNQSVVQVRWVYYFVSGTGSRDRIRLDDITIASSSSGSTATKLVVTSVNGGSNPSANTGFSVTVQSQDNTNTPTNVTSNTGVTLTRAAGTGTLGGTLTGTINSGTNSVTFTGITYNTVENAVQLLASTNSGMSLTAGTSSAFNVLEAATHITLVGVPSTGSTGTPITTFTVEARRTDNSVDLNYILNITLTKASGPGAIGGTLTRAAVAGVATFNDITFNTAGSVTIMASDGTYTDNSGTITISAGSAASDYFRSNAATGNWNTASDWESSPDNAAWMTSTLVPTSAANTITIRNGHNITVNNAQNADQLVIESGGILTYSATALTVNDGTGDDIIIQSGGKLSLGAAFTYGAGTPTVNVNTGGTLSVAASGLTGAGSGVNANNIIYSDASILEYTLSTNPSASGITYFPNVTTEIPIFKITQSLTSVGGGSATTINGVFVIPNGVTISWGGNGTKVFRNGVITTNGGTASMTVASGTGSWSIPGVGELAGTNGTLTLTNVNGINVQGTANVTGKLILGASTTNMNQQGSATLTGAGTISLSGDLTVQIGTYNTNTFTGTYEFTGTSQTIPAGTYTGLEVNGTSPTLSGAVFVLGNLNLTSGILTLGANNLTIYNTGSVTGGSATSYVQTNSTGGLIIDSVPPSTNVNFPVGNSVYNPAIINYSGTIRHWTVVVQDGVNDGILGVNPNAKVKKEWLIEPSDIVGVTATLTLQWNSPVDEDTQFAHDSLLFIGHFDSGAGGNGWYPTTSSGSVAGTIPNSFTTTASGFTAFSPFGVANDGPLPVELALFTSSLNGREVKLNWSTTEEVNNAGFEIQKKSVNADWSKVSFVAGNGTSNVSHSYSYTERNLTTGSYSYRLKQIDNNGNFKYYDLSNEVIVGIPKVYSLSQNYPNPFNPSTKINYDLPVDAKVSVRIIDMTGREVASLVNGAQTAGSYTINFNASSLSSGIYFYQINAVGSQSFNKTMKMTLIK